MEGESRERTPRQNRVLPTGEIVAAPFRGTLMGNRGVLHDDESRLGTARWRSPAWITCVLAFKGRHRTVMSPRSWTELFFLDEAVALAAGHRPCFECRRADARLFAAAWARAHGGPIPSAPAMDAALHAARLEPGTRRQRTFRARLADLPDGVFVEREGSPALLHGGRLHPCRDGGYGAPCPAERTDDVNVLTPRPTVAAIAAGYAPMVAL